MDASQGWYRGSAPPVRAMRKAGYLGNEEELKSIWAWARSNDPHSSVWPTPISGVQEAVRFDTAGWPSENSSCEEWISCVTFWTALREQVQSIARSALVLRCPPPLAILLPSSCQRHPALPSQSVPFHRHCPAPIHVCARVFTAGGRGVSKSATRSHQPVCPIPGAVKSRRLARTRQSGALLINTRAMNTRCRAGGVRPGAYVVASLWGALCTMALRPFSGVGVVTSDVRHSRGACGTMCSAHRPTHAWLERERETRAEGAGLRRLPEAAVSRGRARCWVPSHGTPGQDRSPRRE